MGSDDESYRRFLAGDTSAYDELMIRYGDSLTFYLNGYLRSWQNAEDLMIEAFARIMVKRPSIREGGFKAYLYKTARNLASRFAAKEKRTQTFCLDGQEEKLPGSDELEARILREEKKAVLYRCLDRISPEYREALWLVYMDDLSYAQAAEVMHVNKKKIDNLLTRGRQSLRAELEKAGIDNAYE